MRSYKKEIYETWSCASDSLLYFAKLSLLNELDQTFNFQQIDALRFFITKYMRENYVKQ